MVKMTSVINNRYREHKSTIRNNFQGKSMSPGAFLGFLVGMATAYHRYVYTDFLQIHSLRDKFKVKAL